MAINRENENDIVQIQIDMERDAYDKMQDVGKKSGLTTQEYVTNALQTYVYLLDQHREGKKVYIGTDTIVGKELIFPGEPKSRLRRVIEKPLRQIKKWRK